MVEARKAGKGSQKLLTGADGSGQQVTQEPEKAVPTRAAAAPTEAEKKAEEEAKLDENALSALFSDKKKKKKKKKKIKPMKL